jgi:MtrB/PioB family decaheme-associated outer membrane protein
LPAPIDYTTDQFDMGLTYAGARSRWRLEFSGSQFDNESIFVTWENPFSIFLGDNYLRGALEPGNEHHRLGLSGSVVFSPRFRFTASASVGEMEQDEVFLPYAINPAYEDRPLPRTSLGGKVDVSLFNLTARFNARLARGLDLIAQFRSDERDNRTPVDVYTPILDDVARLDPLSNTPYGYDRDLGKVELRYRTRGRLRLNTGIEKDRLQRSYQEVTDTDELSIWGSLHYSPTSAVNLRFKYENLDRDATTNTQFVGRGRAENPLLRKFNLADRDRDRITAALDLTPGERVSINLSYFATDDDYSRSSLGLNNGEEQSLNLDFAYAASKTSNLYAFLSRDRIESEISGIGGFEEIGWNAVTRDTIATWGFGFAAQARDRVSFGFDYVYSDSDGAIRTATSAGEAPFPVLGTELTNARIYLTYKISDHWAWKLDAIREHYDSSDWQLDGIGPDGLANVLTMGEVSPDYVVKVIRAQATYRF